MRVESPCVDICKLNDRNVCIGCGRTTLEIKAWSSLSKVKRAEVNVIASMRKHSFSGNLPFEDPK